VASGVTYAECAEFLRRLTDPGEAAGFRAAFTGEAPLASFAWVEPAPGTTDAAAPSAPPETAAPVAEAPETPASGMRMEDPVLTGDTLRAAPKSAFAPDPDGLVALVAEGWQMSRELSRHLDDTPQAKAFRQVFRRFFQHLLDRVGAVSPELSAIQGWFQCPAGDAVEDGVEAAMRGLLAVAVEKGWTQVLYDPGTSGLVSDCLAEWGATGRHDLVERSVEALARGLQGEGEERELALTHLMDSRPWVRNPRLLQVILDRLTAQLSEETDAGLYQKGLLIAWDLLEPSLEARDPRQAQSVLALLATLHLHADDDAPAFPERPQLVRHWILGKSRPELVRRLVALAQENGRLAHFPLLGMIAAPILMNDFLAAGPEDIPRYLQAFGEMREQVQAVLVEKLPESLEEVEVRLLLLIIRSCGIDPALALQLSAWLAKGSLELKYNIIGTIEEINDPRGGPALRMALLDDSEGVAVEAVKALVKIGFTPAAPLMVKALQLRRTHGKPHEEFHAAVCDALGAFGQGDTVPWLMDQARKKGILGGPTAPLSVRVAALTALSRFDAPEVWKVAEEVAHEKEPALQEVVDRMIRSRRQRP
jgi:hypothetical protein